MRFSNGKAFREWPARAVTVFGMSGLGKTTLSRILTRGDWFHYSVDYRIGTRYMGEHIVDNFKREAMKNAFLRNLLLTDSIYISSNITFQNLDPLSTYLGKPGDPARGGIPFEEYRRRQAQHRHAEIAAMLDTPEFIDKARNIYGYRHFICDASGSLCEVVNLSDQGDPVLKSLAENTLLLYIRGTPEHARMLVERFREQPKPMYYQPQFLETKWAEFKALKGGIRDDEVDPDEFAAWGFEELLRHRIPLYESIARKYGYAVEAEEVLPVKDEEGFLAMIERAIDRS